jgi:hypothetical protein
VVTRLGPGDALVELTPRLIGAMKRLFPRRLTERPNPDLRRVFARSVTSKALLHLAGEGKERVTLQDLAARFATHPCNT